MSLSKGYVRTNLFILNINRGLAYHGDCLVSLRMGIMRTSLVILTLDRGLAYPEVSGEFDNGEYAGQFDYPYHRHRYGLHWSVW